MTRYVLSILASAALLPLAAQNDVDTEDRDASAAAMQAALPPDTIPNGWQRSGIFNINMTQVNLTNWAAGGFSSVSGIAMFNGTADWKKDRKAWDNSLILAFGGQHIHNGSSPQKTDDRIELNSKYGYELKKSLYLAGVFQFRSQFTEGFNADGDRISNFLAPGYALLGVGLDYRPSENFTVFFSPLTARMIIMNDKTLFGGSTDPDLRVYGVKNGSTTELEVGGYVRMQYKRELAKNITFLTRGDLFSNYLRNPQNIDVTWETLWTFKVNEWFAATLNTVLIYDHDTNLPKVNPEGLPYTGPATQFKQTLGIGLSFKL
ncbi:MAG: DUF3078 domain-containing protein [Flavobacteriales bacterium]|nr:DUF3078 domain-containing protein [Flavobacteriales bacterium]MBK7103252.1 DUF3078 domain-containing protein [Flavobacteriales bacterium]MBK7481400.1 DUF3078 domain-containing protein [Flavobacteriales bacterium]MBK8530274.1 DUF3078 domain-containing protein [Flavobacteriales bacterium]